MKRSTFVASSGLVAAGVLSCSTQSDEPAVSASAGHLRDDERSRSPEPVHARPRFIPPLLRPVLAPRLRPGDRIGIVAPAGPARSPKDLQRARLNVELMGLKPVFGKHVVDSDGYLAGSDHARAEDFNRFARDHSIRGIFALRGGYGTMRILEKIEYAALSDDPKVILGFSDLTALLNAITKRTGLVTFHGPVLAHPDLTIDVVAAMKRAMMHSRPLGRLPMPEVQRLTTGSAKGPIVGGNLSIIAALAGGPFSVPCDGRVLVLEDVREAPYRIDRMLTALRLNGDLGRLAAIGLGGFPQCVPREGDDIPSQTVREVLLDRLSDLGKPVIRGLPVGHVDHQWTIPIGAVATIDADAATFSIDEAAVL